MDRRQLQKIAAAWFGEPFPGQILEALEHFLAALSEANEKVRLVADSTPELVAVRHVADALPLAAELPQGARILDVGSGGGFPGLVVAVVRPDTQVVLLERARRKAAALARLAALAAPSNSRVLAGRFPDTIWTAATDLVSRAVFPPEEWIRLATRAAGRAQRIWAFLSGKQVARETWRRGVRDAGWQVALERAYTLDGGRSRALVCLVPQGPENLQRSL